MSVVSEKSHRRNFAYGNNGSHSYSRAGGGGFSSSRSAVEVDFLLPRFSAAASEGIKLDPERGDDNWAENTTVVTGATSEHSYNGFADRFELDGNCGVGGTSGGANRNARDNGRLRCMHVLWHVFAFLLTAASLLSAPAMVAAPFLLGNLPPFLAGLRIADSTPDTSGDVSTSTPPEYNWPPVQCEVDCQGAMLNMAGKLMLLLITFYVLFWRCALASLPRLDATRAFFVFLTLFSLFAFWLFYVVRILIERDFRNFISFAQYLVDLLLFINCIHAFYELRQLRAVFMITVVRDPDGESRSEQLGQMTIQSAAINILRFYHTDFSTYNPYLDHMRQTAILNGGGGAAGGYRGGGGGGNGRYGSEFGYRAGCGGSGGFKLYDIEGRGGGNDGSAELCTLPEANARILLEASARRRMARHNNDVLRAEDEYERGLTKRRCRLIGCAEEVFAHVQAVNANNANNRVEPMDPSTAARTVLAGLNKPLMRYLKFTRQIPYQNRENIAGHLEKCLAYGFSARTFLQRFFSNRLPPLHSNSSFINGSAVGVPQSTQTPSASKEKRNQDEWLSLPGASKWSILCSEQASGQLQHGVQFVLRSHSTSGHPDAGVQLHCTVSAFPFYNLTEQRPPEKSKFELRIT